MSKQDIIEGLRMALIKGESLQQAMQSFYNSGYNKKDIEAAARELQMSKNKTQHNQNPQNTSKKPQEKVFNKFQKKNIKENKIHMKPSKMVSDYGQEKPKNPKKTLIIIIASLLVVITIILISVYLFREGIINFLTNLFVNS